MFTFKTMRLCEIYMEGVLTEKEKELRNDPL